MQWETWRRRNLGTHLISYNSVVERSWLTLTGLCEWKGETGFCGHDPIGVFYDLPVWRMLKRGGWRPSLHEITLEYYIKARKTMKRSWAVYMPYMRCSQIYKLEPPQMVSDRQRQEASSWAAGHSTPPRYVIPTRWRFCLACKFGCKSLELSRTETLEHR